MLEVVEDVSSFPRVVCVGGGDAQKIVSSFIDGNRCAMDSDLDFAAAEGFAVKISSDDKGINFSSDCSLEVLSRLKLTFITMRSPLRQ